MTKPHNHPPKDHKHNEETLSEFIEEEESKAIRFLKKTAILAIALFMIILMLTFLIPIQTIESLLASIQLQRIPPDFAATIGGATIVIEGKTYEKLLDEYFNEQRFEFKACLLGTKTNHVYTVTDLYIPNIHAQSHTSVMAELCNEQTIIDLHTHPYLSCIFSDVDINSLKSVQQINPDAIIGLMCGKDRFNFYGY